jgi:hypothetical protein
MPLFGFAPFDVQFQGDTGKAIFKGIDPRGFPLILGWEFLREYSGADTEWELRSIINAYPSSPLAGGCGTVPGKGDDDYLLYHSSSDLVEAKKQAYEIINKRRLAGLMDNDTENDGIRIVHYWDNERKKKQHQLFNPDGSNQWVVSKVYQWNVSSQRWEDEGWDLGREAVRFKLEIITTVIAIIGVVISAATLGTGSGLTAVQIAAINAAYGAIASLEVKIVYGQPILIGDLLNTMTKLGTAMLSQPDIKAQFDKLGLAIQKEAGNLFGKSFLDKVKDIGSQWGKSFPRIDSTFLNNIKNNLPDAQSKKAWDDAINAYSVVSNPFELGAIRRWTNNVTIFDTAYAMMGAKTDQEINHRYNTDTGRTNMSVLRTVNLGLLTNTLPVATNRIVAQGIATDPAIDQALSIELSKMHLEEMVEFLAKRYGI